jgi:phosphoribosyl 1,2-cyclic phosphodiesterase
MEGSEADMKLWVLGSGSRGNAVLVQCGESHVVIDAGFGPRILRKRLQAVGVEPQSIEACVITHEHSDHIRGAARAARRWHWPLLVTEGTYANSRLALLGTPAAQFRAGTTLEFSDMTIETFRTPHDAVEPIGVVVTSRASGARVAICTDIGHASRSVRRMVQDVDMLVIESNHDDVMLANGPYPLFLQRRIASSVGHLSNRECGMLVRDSINPRLRQVVLAHLSENNNTPTIAYESMRAAIKGTAFRGALFPALQDAVTGPFAPRPTKSAVQLSLGL